MLKTKKAREYLVLGVMFAFGCLSIAGATADYDIIKTLVGATVLGTVLASTIYCVNKMFNWVNRGE